MKDIAISALLAWITCSGGSQLLYHEDTQTLCIDPHDKNLRPVANSTDLTAVCTVLKQIIQPQLDIRVMTALTNIAS